jgi:putative SOS response-associated peptidase YedK
MMNMCGRYSITLPREAIRRIFQTHGELPNWPVYYNAPPTTALPVVRQAKEGDFRELLLMTWGWPRIGGSGPRLFRSPAKGTKATGRGKRRSEKLPAKAAKKQRDGRAPLGGLPARRPRARNEVA